MVKVKPLDVIVQKWVNKASVATEDYKLGVQNPRRDWAEATSAAEKNWEAGIQQAIANKLFSKGVQAAGTDKWKRGALEKGADRYAQGIRSAEEDYRKGMAGVRAVLEGITLPARGPRGDPKNIDRVRVIAEALHKWRLTRTK